MLEYRLDESHFALDIPPPNPHLGELITLATDGLFGSHRRGGPSGGLRIGPLGVDHRLMRLHRRQDAAGVGVPPHRLLDSRDQPRENTQTDHGHGQKDDQSVDHAGSAQRHPFSFNAARSPSSLTDRATIRVVSHLLLSSGSAPWTHGP